MTKLRLAFAFVLVLGQVQPAFAVDAKGITEVSCPEPKPKFDPAQMDRTLKEPKYASQKPMYRFFAFGPEGNEVVALVIDESKGTGAGYDTLYIDFNANKDITEPGDKIALLSPRQPKTAPRDKGFFLVQLSDWGKPPVVQNKKFDFQDTTFNYTTTMDAAAILLDCVLKDGSWHTLLRVDDGAALWSPRKEDAQVYRFGGNELSFKNEHFVNKTFKPGEALDMNLTAPFFAGSSPSVVFEQGQNWVPAGYDDINVRLESLADSNADKVDITLRGY